MTILDNETDTVHIEPGDHEKLSHIIHKKDEMRGYMEGKPVTALCGKQWVPTRDPQKFPVCKGCLEVLQMIKGVGGGK